MILWFHILFCDTSQDQCMIKQRHRGNKTTLYYGTNNGSRLFASQSKPQEIKLNQQKQIRRINQIFMVKKEMKFNILFLIF